jgi:hypothetical protein
MTNININIKIHCTLQQKRVAGIWVLASASESEIKHRQNAKHQTKTQAGQ